MTSVGAAGRLRVGVAGTGFAACSHIDALRRLGGVEVVAVSSGSPDRARQFAATHRIPLALDDHRELAAHEGVDVVHVCTRNDSHADLSISALANRKHVFAEKPLALTSEEGADVLQAERAAVEDGCVAGVCFQYRHYPLVRQLRHTLARHDHGDLHFVRGGYLQDWLLRETDWNWRLDPAVGGHSRAIADIGSHWVDLVQHVTGDQVVAVLADLATTHDVRELPPRSGPAVSGANGARVSVTSEDFGSVLIRFSGGVRGTFTVSQTSAGHKNRLFFELDAAAASLAWDQETPERAWVGRRGQPNLEYLREAEQLYPEAGALTRLPPGHPEGWSDALYNACADFYRAASARGAAARRDSSFATFGEAQQVVEVVEAIIASDETQAWTEVGGDRTPVARS